MTKVSLPDTLYGAAAVVVLSPPPADLAKYATSGDSCCGVACAVTRAGALDVAKDPTAHNLGRSNALRAGRSVFCLSQGHALEAILPCFWRSRRSAYSSAASNVEVRLLVVTSIQRLHRAFELNNFEPSPHNACASCSTASLFLFQSSIPPLDWRRAQSRGRSRWGPASRGCRRGKPR